MENYDNNSEQSSTSIEQNHVEKFWNGILIGPRRKKNHIHVLSIFSHAVFVSRSISVFVSIKYIVQKE